MFRGVLNEGVAAGCQGGGGGGGWGGGGRCAWCFTIRKIVIESREEKGEKKEGVSEEKKGKEQARRVLERIKSSSLRVLKSKQITKI